MDRILHPIRVRKPSAIAVNGRRASGDATDVHGARPHDDESARAVSANADRASAAARAD